MRDSHAQSALLGDHDVLLDVANPNFFRYRVARWIIGNLGGLVGVIVGVGFLRAIPERYTQPTLMMWFTIFEVAGILLFTLQTLWPLALLRLDYEQRWYLVSDRSL